MSASKGDELRTPDKAFTPDERSAMFGIKKIDNQYDHIVKYELNLYVPEKVVTQYEVARNLYLYAYNVYRFYMVAQHQVLTVLELAIKYRFGDDEIKKYGKEIKKGGGLSACLHFVIDKSYIVNSDFSAWHRQPIIQAEHDYRIEKIKEMESKGMDEIELDISEAKVINQPEDFDYLKVILERMPKIRNKHAHGSSMLHNQVLLTFENVSTIINKIYQPKL